MEADAADNEEDDVACFFVGKAEADAIERCYRNLVNVVEYLCSIISERVRNSLIVIGGAGWKRVDSEQRWLMLSEELGVQTQGRHTQLCVGSWIRAG